MRFEIENHLELRSSYSGLMDKCQKETKKPKIPTLLDSPSLCNTPNALKNIVLSRTKTKPSNQNENPMRFSCGGNFEIDEHKPRPHFSLYAIGGVRGHLLSMFFSRRQIKTKHTYITYKTLIRRAIRFEWTQSKLNSVVRLLLNQVVISSTLVAFVNNHFHEKRSYISFYIFSCCWYWFYLVSFVYFQGKSLLTGFFLI